jgi:hypothetical protein
MRTRALTWLGACVFLISAVPERGWAEEARDDGQEDPAVPQGAVPALSVGIFVNAQDNVRPISPEIYGVSGATAAQLADLRVPLHRRGGNHTTRYNWQLNATSRANDWYFQSVPEGEGTPGAAADAFIANSRSAGAQPMLTVPTLGWVAKLGPEREKLASFSIAKYGPQLDFDEEWFPDAGNGVQMTGAELTGNDPTDANMPSDPAFQQGWVQHLVNTWGTAAQGGTRYYLLDNEPSLWHSTHRDVHPTGATMEQVRDRLFAYGATVKAVDPGAQLVGPEEWGWAGYFYSGYDQQYFQRNGSPPISSLPDRAEHGQWDYLPWLLDQLRQEAGRTGQRTLDVLSVHFYPQGGEYSDDISTEQQLRRNRSTRSMWDPNYVDDSWIEDKVRLIPRLRQWVNTYYPGTRIGITEYNWGAENHINGATAQADLLGIFGREGLDMAVRWGTPAPSTPTYKAIKLYRNYDGNGSGFGNLSVTAVVPSRDTVSAYAALRTSDGALTVMVVSKFLSGTASLTLDLMGFSPTGPAQVWQLTSANTLARKADRAVTDARLTATVPASSITLFVIPGDSLSFQ